LAKKRSSERHKIEFAPLLGDPFKDGFHLPRRINIEWHNNRRIEFPRKRLDILPGFVVHICNGNFRAERPERLGASPGDGIFIGNTNDQTLSCPQGAWLSRRQARLS
jgi:hypothetical protein